MKYKRLTKEEYKITLYKHNPRLRMLSEFNSLLKKIHVIDDDGIEYLVGARELLMFKHPKIRTAINKEIAFNIHLNKIHPNLKIIGKYEATNKKTQIIDELGIIYLVKPESLLRGSHPSIISAVDKNNAFIKIAENIHGKRYDYSKVNYIGDKTEIIIICPEHGEFKQRPNNHVKQKQGCPKCNLTRGWSKKDWIEYAKNKQCYFYIIKCFSDSELFVKMGITTSTIKRRFQSKREMPYDFDIIVNVKGNGEEVWNLEKFYQQQFKNYKYVPEKKFKGIGECFNKKILKQIKF